MTNPTTEDMERAVFEKLTGKCWHGERYIVRYGQGQLSKYVPGGWKSVCGKCHSIEGNDRDEEAPYNPPLATSLDAWRPIWEAMTDEQKGDHDFELITVRLNTEKYGFDWEQPAMHHLTAAYNVIKKGE